MEKKEIERIFYRDGFRLGLEHLEGGLGVETMKEAISALYEAVDSLLEAFLRRTEAEGRPADCRKGCAWCCHQAVFAVTHEVLFLKEYVREHSQGGEQAAFLERAREKSLASLNKELDEQLKLRIACPFLRKGACAVYPARPMACRIYLSWSEKACRREHGHPGGRQQLRELFEFPLTAGRMLNEGFVAGLKQRGLVSTELPLEQGYASVVTLGQDFASWIG
jgi:Fe-S-cluster containining protein